VAVPSVPKLSLTRRCPVVRPHSVTCSSFSDPDRRGVSPRRGCSANATLLVHASSYGTATSLFTTSGRAAREFRYRAGISMIGINVGVAAPMAFFPFGGSKISFYGDLRAQGTDAVQFFTDRRVVISRW
jgi:hypothetical protein